MGTSQPSVSSLRMSMPSTSRPCKKGFASFNFTMRLRPVLSPLSPTELVDGSYSPS